jgi:methylmalonyl-CoA mutase N-terminal domain/subunit
MSDWKDGEKRYLARLAKAKTPERRKTFATSSGIPLAPLYTPAAAPADAYPERLGFPGEYPFTRGVQSTMYRGRYWTMRQYAGFGSAEDANQRYHYLLKSGQTGLSVAFDLPTQMGRDADHERARGEVGKVGVSISSLRDMQVLLQGLPLADVSTSMTINATAPILLCLYAAVGQSQGLALEQLSGTRSGSSRMSSPSARSASRSGTPFPSAATTSARPARRRHRRSPSRWPTASRTSTRR